MMRGASSRCRDVPFFLPFERVTDESVLEFEHEHLPAEAWPPTGWFVPWVAGQDLFDIPENRSPVELRWLSYRRT